MLLQQYLRNGTGILEDMGETSTLPVWELNSGSARKGKDIDLKLGVP